MTTENSILKNMWDAIRKEQAEYCKCYSPKPSLNDEDFAKMLVFDGCFITELLYRQETNKELKKWEKTDFVFNNNWIIPCLQQDLVFLENQIPFSALAKLFELAPKVVKSGTALQSQLSRHSQSQTTQPTASIQTYSLEELIEKFFDPILPTIPVKMVDSSTTNQHLLDLLRKHLLHHEDIQRRIELEVEDDPIWEHTTCATDLQNAGVRFKRKETYGGILDITFSKEALEIPPFYFGKSWATLFLNMIALEQCHRDYADSITSYAILLDNLINTSDDVRLLLEKRIIHGTKEEHERIAEIINSLSKEAIYTEFFYDDVCRRLNAYCKRKSKKWRAAFYENYIHTPWAGISLIGALVLLALALIQTVFTILSWKLALDAA